jgi:hypothetical protein
MGPLPTRSVQTIYRRKIRCRPPIEVRFPTLSFGYGVGLVAGYLFLLVGDRIRFIGGTNSAGQVYVYEKN